MMDRKHLTARRGLFPLHVKIAEGQLGRWRLGREPARPVAPTLLDLDSQKRVAITAVELHATQGLHLRRTEDVIVMNGPRADGNVV